MAAFQLRRFTTLPDRLERRARIGEYYTDRFAGLEVRGVLAPPPGADGRCFYVYSLLADRRDALRDHLAARGIGSHVYYPAPLPRQPAFAGHAQPGRDWPAAASAARRQLALPTPPHPPAAQA